MLWWSNLIALASAIAYINASTVTMSPNGQQALNVSLFHNNNSLSQSPDSVLLGGVLKKRSKIKSIQLEVVKSSASANHIFVGTVNIGGISKSTNKKKNNQKGFKMLFDTVTPDILVMTENVVLPDKDPPRLGYKEPNCAYSPTDSTYYVPKKRGKGKYRIENNDSSQYSGEIYTDAFQIGGVVLESMKLIGVKAMNWAAVCFRGSNYDGIIGLANTPVVRSGAVGGGSVSAARSNVVLDKLMAANDKKKRVKITRPIFSFYIRPDGERGTVTMGNIDSRHVVADTFNIYMAEKVDDRGDPVYDWRLKFDGMFIGGKVVSRTFVGRFESTFKYGIYAPSTRLITTALLAVTPGAERLDNGRVVIDCDEREGLPNLELMIGNGNQLVSFKGEEYFPFRSAGPGGTPGNLCESFVVDHSIDGYTPPPDDVFAIGVPFMKKYVTSFDTASNAGARIGIGLARHTTFLKEKE